MFLDLKCTKSLLTLINSAGSDIRCPSWVNACRGWWEGKAVDKNVCNKLCQYPWYFMRRNGLKIPLLGYKRLFYQGLSSCEAWKMSSNESNIQFNYPGGWEQALDAVVISGPCYYWRAIFLLGRSISHHLFYPFSLNRHEQSSEMASGGTGQDKRSLHCPS